MHYVVCVALGLQSMADIDAIAVTRGPGLELCLRVGCIKAEVNHSLLMFISDTVSDTEQMNDSKCLLNIDCYPLL